MVTILALGFCFSIFICCFLYVAYCDTIKQIQKDMERKALDKIGGSYGNK